MQWDAITAQWPWFSAAGVLVVFLLTFAGYSIYRPKAHSAKKSIAAGSNAADKHGWISTGRIDFVDPESIGVFTLQAEETRIVESLGGMEHREIRWRTATLDEAKTVLVSYHAQRNLTMAANLVVSAPTALRRNTDEQSETRDFQLKKNEASDAQVETDVKPGAADVPPKATSD
jgi:hypothetical protein